MGENLPAAHFKQAPDPATVLYVPAAHVVHEPEEPVDPGLQRHSTLPHCLSLKVPAGHGLHAAFPVSGLKKPAGHGMQD